MAAEETVDRLPGITYPATKQDIIEAAITAGCSQETIEALQCLPREQYPNRQAMARDLAGRR